MENLDSKISVQPDNIHSNDFQTQLDGLRSLMVSVLILIVIISGTFNIYLLRQWRTTSKDLAAVRPQAAQIIAEYQQKSGPLMKDFVNKLTEYGRTHPDFAPILAKYQIKTTEATGPAPGSPATTSPKKK
jgi:hypothetical protein